MPKKLDVGSIQRRVASEDSAPSAAQIEQRESPDYLGRRVEAQNNLIKGKRERRTVYRVDPATCKIRTDHDRDYTSLTEENCRDLIEGIKVHGQEIPAIVRQLEGDKDYTYEIIAGARRHWVTSYLGLDLIVEPRELSDEEAFILSDEENRNRQDISDYERAQKYKRALDSHYKNQAQMAERMGVTKDWLSRYMDLAGLPSDIVKAYDNLADIKIHHSRVLKPLLKNNTTARKVIDVAKGLHSHPQPGAVVLSRLKAAAISKLKSTPVKTQKYLNKEKKPILLIKNSANKIVLELNKNTTVSEQEWLVAAKQFWSDYLQK